MMEQELLCAYCYTKFDESDRRPKMLPCGHHYCSLCLSAAQTNMGKLQCRDVSHDTAQSFYLNPLELPDSFVVLRLLKQNRDREGLEPSPSKYFCSTCAQVASGNCLDDGHLVCNLKAHYREKRNNLCVDLQSSLTQEREEIQKNCLLLKDVAAGVDAVRLDREAQSDAAAAFCDTVMKEMAIGEVTEAIQRLEANLSKSRARLADLKRDNVDLSPDGNPVLTGFTALTIGSKDGGMSWSGEMNPTQRLAMGFALSLLKEGHTNKKVPERCGEQDESLALVFQQLNESDLVSAGQVCVAWRRAARKEELWRHKKVSVAGDRDIRRAARVLRFAPCIGTVKFECTSAGAQDLLYRELMNTECKVVRLELSRSLMSHLKEAELLRKLAPHLKSLAIGVASANTVTGICKMQNLRDLYVKSYHGPLASLCSSRLVLPGSRLETLSILEGPAEVSLALLRMLGARVKCATVPLSGRMNVGCLRSYLEPPGAFRRLRTLLLTKREGHTYARCHSQMAVLKSYLEGTIISCSHCC